jgi:hypothetical protein
VTTVSTLAPVVVPVVSDDPRERPTPSRDRVETNAAPETKMGREAAGSEADSGLRPVVRYLDIKIVSSTKMLEGARCGQC